MENKRKRNRRRNEWLVGMGRVVLWGWGVGAGMGWGSVIIVECLVLCVITL